MSKNFEQAYKRLAQDEIPDLWDRIEAGLKEKSAPAGGIMPEDSICHKTVEKENTDKRRENNQREEEQKEEKTRSGIKDGIGPFAKKIRKYSGMAAAVLCAAIIVPAALFLSRMGGGYSSSDMAATAPESIMESASEDLAKEESGEAALEEDGAEAAAGTLAGGSGEASSQAGGAEAAAETLGEESAEAATEEESAEAVAEESAAVFTEASEEDSGAALEDKRSQTEDLNQNMTQKSREERPAQGTALNNVIISVMDIISDKEGQGGSWYTVIVKEDPSGYLKEGELITVFAPVHFATALEKGEEFEVDIVCEDKDGYSFLLTGYHQKNG